MILATSVDSKKPSEKINLTDKCPENFCEDQSRADVSQELSAWIRYNDAHHYRAENPLSHLHEDEAPVETDKLKSFH